MEKVKKKYSLNNSYFKFRQPNTPDTLLEIAKYHQEHGELPFECSSENWAYEAFCERQKRAGVFRSQYFTPDSTARQMAELASELFPEKDTIVMDPCCGAGQLTRALDKMGYNVTGFDWDNDLVETCKILYPGHHFFQSEFSGVVVDDEKKPQLIVANPPYEIPVLTEFLNWVHETLADDGYAILLIPKNFLDKDRPKPTVTAIQRFQIEDRYDMEEDFLRTKVSAEIVMLTKKADVTKAPVKKKAKVQFVKGMEYKVTEPDHKAFGKIMVFREVKGAFHVFEDEHTDYPYFSSNIPEMEIQSLLKPTSLKEGIKKVVGDSKAKTTTDTIKPLNKKAEWVMENLSPEGINAIKEAAESFQASTSEPAFQKGDRVVVIDNPKGPPNAEFAGREGTIHRLCSEVFPDFVYVEFDLTGREKVQKIKMCDKLNLVKVAQSGIQSFKNLTPSTMKEHKTETIDQIMMINLSDIFESPLNPRKYFDSKAISELATSIAEKGVLSPILVRPVMDSLPQRYEVVCGARRFRASNQADQKTIPAMIRHLDDEEALELMIIENLQRKDVNPMEEAAAIGNMMEHYHDFTEVGSRIGKSARFVAERHKLNNLIEPFQKALYQGAIMVKTANELAKVSKEAQQMIFEEAVLDTSNDPLVDDQESIRWKGWITADSLINMVERKATASLVNPPFDPEDEKLAKAPACSKCQYNSSNQPVLFTDTDGPKCLNSVCFTLKSEISFHNKMQEAAESGKILVNVGWSELDEKTKQAVKELGVTVLSRNDITEFSAEAEEPDDLEEFEDFKEYWLSINDDKAETPDKVIRVKYNSYCLTHAEEMEAYKKAVKLEEEAALQKGYQRAFVVAGYGNAKGTYTLVKPKSAAKAEAAQIGNPETMEITEQLEKIQAREARAEELDREKIYAQAWPLLGNEWMESKKELYLLEKKAVIIALCHQYYDLRQNVHKMLGVDNSDYGMLSLYNRINQANFSVGPTNEMLNYCLRFTIQKSLIDAATLDYDKSGRPAAIMNIVRNEHPQELAEIELNQKGIALARKERVEKKQADLKAKLAELTGKESTNA